MTLPKTAIDVAALNHAAISESDIPMHGWAPYDEVHRERLRAHAKHGAAGHSCEQVRADDPEWLAILGEEFGEVCHELTYDAGAAHWSRLRNELVQVAAMACAWIEAIDRLEFTVNSKNQ